MTNWKKTISAITSAALLASVFATSAVAAMGAAGESDQTDWLTCSVAAVASVESCSQVADGISSVTLIGDVDGATADPNNGSLYITATGASIIGVAGGKFTLAAGVVTTGLLGAGLGLATADTMTLRAPAAPGTTVVSVYLIDGVTGIAGAPETLTITWTATSGLGVSVANSVVQTNVAASDCSVVSNAFDDTKLSTAAATPTATTVAELCMLVRDGNGSTVPNGTSVAATITPVGLVGPAATFGQTSSSTTTNGVARFHIVSTGVAGLATIATSVTLGSTTTTFAPVTFTFTGSLATLTVTQTKFAVAKGTALVNPYNIATVVGKDAAGNTLPCDGAWVAKSGTTTVIADGSLDVLSATTCDVNIIGGLNPATLGSTAITVQNAAGTVKATPFTVYVSDVAATVTVAFSAATIVPGGSATITVEIKDAGGRPAADGTASNLIVSAGAIVPTAPTTLNGKATATYLAPFNTGVVTALATVGSLTGSGSANIGAVVPVASGSNASALGATKTGTYTTDTKVAALGKYVTWKFSFGAAAAGKTVGVLVATKNSAGVWSSFTRLTARVADASGNAYFWIYKSSAAWISVQGDLAGSLTPARQARWK